MGFVLLFLLVGIAYNALYGVYAVKKGDGGDICYVILLTLTLLSVLFLVTRLLLAEG
ncbi:MAG: hypothetical protein Q4E65_00460 [Clostridia bacterium]|nr:hypothetical protein [Clostridia bacterium]